MSSTLNAKDVSDLKAAMALLTREEIEAFALDRAIRANEATCLLSEEVRADYFKNLLALVHTSVPTDDLRKMNEAMDIVKNQITIG